MKTNPLTPEMLQQIDAYWRATNYLSVGQKNRSLNENWTAPLRRNLADHSSGVRGIVGLL